MTETDQNVLDYIVVCINKFADRYKMHIRESYIYLSRYKGIEFLKEFYDAEHTLSFEEVLDDLAAICRKNGGIAGWKLFHGPKIAWRVFCRYNMKIMEDIRCYAPIP